MAELKVTWQAGQGLAGLGRTGQARRGMAGHVAAWRGWARQGRQV